MLRNTSDAQKARPTPVAERYVVGGGLPKSFFTDDRAQPGAESWAVIAFGSNVGKSVEHIENGLHNMDQQGIQIVRLSRLYETPPQYYTKQQKFLNGVAIVKTKLSPLQLLRTLQAIELLEGRTWDPAKPKGPRSLDLDIIMYQGVKMQSEELTIPHPLMMERAFVLVPLVDIAGPLRLWSATHPDRKIPIRKAVQQLQEVRATEKCIPMTCLSSNGLSLKQYRSVDKTKIMAILNCTPDSFSDGGTIFDGDNPENVAKIVAKAREHIAAGAEILDVGGQSTKPGATLMSADDELARVLPALRAIQEIPEVMSGKVAISLDTFYASVVRACSAENLIDIVNDISGGEFDADMLSTVAACRKSIVLMHMRGTPATMQDPSNLDYGDEGVVEAVAQKLNTRAQCAAGAGIPPWRIILDPGIGFAKSDLDNALLLRHGPRRLGSLALRLRFFGWLVGPSRKKFIAKAIDNTDILARDWGTSAPITAAIQSGAHIVRVHNTEAMRNVVAVADAIYRPSLKYASEESLDEQEDTEESSNARDSD